jgi:hypothetical protein
MPGQNVSITCSLHTMFLRTCHFKQAGLYDGAPFSAPFSVVKTCNVGLLRSCGARCGRLFMGYVTSGNLSNSCLMGAGTSKMLRDGVCCCRRLAEGSALPVSCDIMFRWVRASVFWC